MKIHAKDLRPGDDVQIDGWLWEVVSIRPLHPDNDAFMLVQVKIPSRPTSCATASEAQVEQGVPTEYNIDSMAEVNAWRLP